MGMGVLGERAYGGAWERGTGVVGPLLLETPTRRSRCLLGQQGQISFDTRDRLS